MTLLFSRPVEGPATHAFVVGVGNYPDAAGGENEYLQQTPNLPSAADSAKMICDWLLENLDDLVAPLASLEVLISDPSDDGNRYPWAPGMAIAGATTANVADAGVRWLRNFASDTKNTAFFFACGHGASLATGPALFLEELNMAPQSPWPHIHVGGMAQALSLYPDIDIAYIFVDACGQKIAEFELTPIGNRAPTVFYRPLPYGAVALPKVMLTTAAPEGQLAYDAPLSAQYHPHLAGIPIGRFTQTLLMALNGSSVRSYGNRWAVDSTGFRDDLKQLKQFYFPNMVDYPFEPTPLYGFNDVRPFVYPRRPVIPYFATMNPNDSIEDFEFCIRDAPPPPNPSEGGSKHDPVRRAWIGEISPRILSAYAVAFNVEDCFYKPFNPTQPQFNVKIEMA